MQPRGVQHRAGLVVHLHAADQRRTVVQRRLQFVPLQLSRRVHADHAHVVALFSQQVEGLAHRGMLHRADSQHLPAPHAAHRAEYGQVVGFRAPGGEYGVATGAAHGVQQPLAGIAQ